MSKVLVQPNDRGWLSVTIPSKEIELESLYLAQDLTNFVIIDKADMPKEVEFFEAFELDGSTVVINIQKAKELTKNRIRTERKPILEQLDIEFIKALETGLDTNSIVAEKQRLRDITLEIDRLGTISEMKQFKVESLI